MASPSTPWLCLCILVLLFAVAVNGAFSDCFPAIFSFGDSLADTGNAMHCGSMPPTVGKLPYGQTFFHRPTGRFSDGRLLVDFVAQELGLPLLQPYLEGRDAVDFHYGANFAVAGATALNNRFFKDRGFQVDWTDSSLGVQIQWFKQLLQLVSSSPAESRNLISKSLILLGEIGGNDYNYAFADGRTINEIQTYVPSVVAEIVSAINVLIELGAKTIVVPGNLPIGCAPVYLTPFKTEAADDYDSETGCINWLNDFSKYHNDMLLDRLDDLRKRYPDVIISYADYYGAAMTVFHSPQLYGFESPLLACCGAEGPYNFDISAWCGNEGSKVCNDSSTAFSWDGAHLTEAGYHAIAINLMERGFAYPSFLEGCLASQSARADL